jgi:hypothetical protein
MAYDKAENKARWWGSSWGLLLVLFAAQSPAQTPSPGDARSPNPPTEKAAEPPRFSFGALADVQYCDYKTGGRRRYRESPRKLAECVHAYNKLDLGYVIHLGDFIDRDAASFARV